MPTLTSLKTSWVNGELDPLIRGRPDLSAYRNGADKMRNVLVIPQGGFRRRDGLEYIDTIPELSPGVPSKVRLVPHEFSTVQAYMLAFHDSAMRVYKNGVFQVSVASVYTSAQLPEISWTQNLDTLLVFHPDLRPRAFQRQGSDTVWSSFDWELKNIPSFPFGFVTTTTVTPAAATGLNIAFTAGAAIFAAGDVGKYIRGNSGYAKIVSFTSSTVVNADILVNFKDTSAIPAGDWTLEEDVWSAARGWPVSGTFFQGRLWFAGSKSRPSTVWASRSGDANDFDTTSTADDFGIDVTADTDDVAAFRNIHVGRHLQVFSSSAEFYVPVSDKDPVTPTNIVLRRTTQRGSQTESLGSPVHPRVFDVDGATFFLQLGGKALREFLFTDTEQAYSANILSLLASHLVREPVSMAVRKAISTDDADYVWLVNSDGTLAAFCTLRLQDVNGWTLCETKGLFKETGVILEDSYFIVERVINGATVTYLERFNKLLHTDAGKLGSGSQVTQDTTLTWLNGEEVAIRLDTAVQVNQNVAANAITFARPADAYQIGLPFPDVDGRGNGTWVKTLPAEEALPSGSQLGKRKRIVDVTSRVFETEGISINGNFVPPRSFGSNLLDQPIQPVTADVKVEGLLGWDEEGAVEITQDSPVGMTVLALGYNLSTS